MSTLQGSLCRLFRVTEAEPKGKVNSSKWAPWGEGRGGCTACFFHCCFEFLLRDNRSTMLLVSAPQCCWCLLHNSVDQL